MGYVSSASQFTAGKRRGKVLLLGLEESTAATWAAAAQTIDSLCLAVADLAACEGQAQGESSLVLVAAAGAFDPRLANRSEPALGRTTLIVISDNAEEIPFWGWVAWGATASSTNPDEASAILAAAIEEAALRCNESDLMGEFRQRSATLNANEQLVFEAICAGRLNKQIANDFGVSVRTVEQRRRRLFEKMGVESAVPLAAFAAKVQALEDQIQRDCPRVFVRPTSQANAPGSVTRPKFADRQTKNRASDAGSAD